MIPFEKFLFLFNGFPRVCLIGNVDASYRFFSFSRQRGMKISLSTNERIEFRVTRRNDDSGWEEGKKKEKEIIMEFCIMFFEEKEMKGKWRILP